MHIGQALDLVSRYDSLRNPLTTLGDYLDPQLISRCLAESGMVTLRKRRLPLEMMVWCIVGMALERKEPLHQIVNRLDIMLPGDRLRGPQRRYPGTAKAGKRGCSPGILTNGAAVAWLRHPSSLVRPDVAGRGWRGLANRQCN